MVDLFWDMILMNVCVTFTLHLPSSVSFWLFSSPFILKAMIKHVDS